MNSTENKKTIIIASAILTNSKSEVLLLKRAGINKSYKGHWQLPEGKIEFGEQPEEALKRELMEELGIEVQNLLLVTINSTIITLADVIYNIIRIVFKTTTNEIPRLSQDHEDYKWVNPSKIEETAPLLDGTKETITSQLK